MVFEKKRIVLLFVTESRRDGEQLGEDQAPADVWIRQESLAGSPPQKIRNGIIFDSLCVYALISLAEMRSLVLDCDLWLVNLVILLVVKYV